MGCEACMSHKDSNHSSHTNDENCRYNSVQKRAHSSRIGQHPRDPAVPASSSSTSQLRGSSSKGELGAEGELEIDAKLERERKSAARANADKTLDADDRPSASAGHADADCVGESRPAKRKYERRQLIGPHSKKDAADDDERDGLTRRTYRDAVVGPEEPSDWTDFDVRRSLRSLRFGDATQTKLTLRKLHIRFWHAPAAAMKKLLQRAGVPARVLQEVDAVVHTCAVCREWSKPRPQAVASASLADHFNHQVEADLMFVYDWIIFHMIDRCTRWYHAILIPSKTEDSMIDGISSWIKHHGPPRNCIPIRKQVCVNH